MQGGTDIQNTISGLKVPINTTYNFEIIHEKNHDQFQNQALQPNYLSMTQQCSQPKIQQIKQTQQQNPQYKLAFQIAQQQNKQILQQMSKQKTQLDKILSQEILMLQKKIQKSLINQTLQREKSSKLQMKCQQLQTQLYTLAKKQQISTEILKELKGVIVQKEKFINKYQQLFRFKLLHADNKVSSYSKLLEEEIQFRDQYLIKKINEVQEEEVKHKEEIKCKSEKIEEMKIQEETMKSVVTQLKQDLQRVSQKIQDHQTMYDNTIKQTIELRKGFGQINKLFSSRSQKQDEFQQQVRDIKQQDRLLSATDIEQLINRVREIIVDRKQMVTQLDHLQKQNLILQQHQQASFQSNQQNQTQFANMRVKIRQLEYRNSQLSQQLNFIQAKKQQEDNQQQKSQKDDFQIENYKQRIQDLKHILQKKETLINNLTLQLQSQNNVISNLRDEIFELQQNKDLTALRSDNTSLRYELDKVRSLNLQQVHKISQMQENMDALKNERSNLVNQMQNQLQETADITKLLKQTKLQLQWQRRQMIAETKQPDLILEPQYQKSIDQQDMNRHSRQFSSISSGMPMQRTSKSIDSLASPQLRCRSINQQQEQYYNFATLAHDRKTSFAQDGIQFGGDTLLTQMNQTINAKDEEILKLKAKIQCLEQYIKSNGSLQRDQNKIRSSSCNDRFKREMNQTKFNNRVRVHDMIEKERSMQQQSFEQEGSQYTFSNINTIKQENSILLKKKVEKLQQRKDVRKKKHQKQLRQIDYLLRFLQAKIRLHEDQTAYLRKLKDIQEKNSVLSKWITEISSEIQLLHRLARGGKVFALEIISWLDQQDKRIVLRGIKGDDGKATDLEMKIKQVLLNPKCLEQSLSLIKRSLDKQTSLNNNSESKKEIKCKEIQKFQAAEKVENSLNNKIRQIRDCNQLISRQMTKIGYKGAVRDFAELFKSCLRCIGKGLQSDTTLLNYIHLKKPCESFKQKSNQAFAREWKDNIIRLRDFIQNSKVSRHENSIERTNQYQQSILRVNEQMGKKFYGQSNRTAREGAAAVNPVQKVETMISIIKRGDQNVQKSLRHIKGKDISSTTAYIVRLFDIKDSSVDDFMAGFQVSRIWQFFGLV